MAEIRPAEESENSKKQVEEMKERMESGQSEETAEKKEEAGVSEEAAETQKEGAESQEETTETGVPFGISNLQSPGLYVSLGVILIVLAVLIWDNIRKKKDKKATESVGEAEVENIQSVPKEEKKFPIIVGKLHAQGARSDQQDSFGITNLSDEDTLKKKGMLAVVADGMGGLSNGGQVSSLLVKNCHDIFYDLPEYISPEDRLLEMLIQSNMRINQLLTGAQRSGSTFVSAIIKDGYLHFLTVGDSRIYLCRGGALIQLNREHIYKEELALQAVNGMIPASRLKNDPQLKSLTSYLGKGQIPHLDRNLEGLKLISGDRILMVSDGVFGTLTSEQLETALALPTEEAADKMRTMIEMANKPFQDNYTALILEYRE